MVVIILDLGTEVLHVSAVNYMGLVWQYILRQASLKQN